MENRWVAVAADLWELMNGDRCLARVIRFAADGGNWSICLSDKKGIQGSGFPSAFAAMVSVRKILGI